MLISCADDTVRHRDTKTQRLHRHCQEHVTLHRVSVSVTTMLSMLAMISHVYMHLGSIWVHTVQESPCCTSTAATRDLTVLLLRSVFTIPQ